MRSMLEILSQHLEEVRLSDIATLKNGDDEDLTRHVKKILDLKFTEERNLPTQTTLKKRYGNKKIKIWFKWNHTKTHNLIERIKSRTNFRSINEFKDFFIDLVNTLLPDYVGKEIIGDGRYVVYSKEYNITIILDIRLNRVLFGDSNKIGIDVVSVISGHSANTRNVRNVIYI